MLSGVQIVGELDGALEVRSNFLVVRTMELDGSMKLFASGQSRDLVEIQDGQPRFRTREFVLDSRAVETLLVIPL